MLTIKRSEVLKTMLVSVGLAGQGFGAALP